MSIKTKREVIKSLSCRKRIIYGKERECWEIYFGSDGTGKKIRAQKHSREEALLCIDQFYRRLKEVGDAVTILTAAEIHDAKTALTLLRNAGITITLTDAVRRMLSSSTLAADISQKTLGEAYVEYYNSIPDQQHHHKYAVQMRVGKWVMAHGGDRLCSCVTAKQVAAYLVQFTKSDKTYNNRLSYIKSFLSWCTKKERMYLAVNPCEDMTLRKLAWKEPEYMPVADFEKMIRHFEATGNRKALVVVVLSFFCGVRTDEVGRLMDDPSQINLEEETIRIAMPKGWTQGVAPRALHVPAVAMDWIHAYKLNEVFGTFNQRNMRTDMYNEVRELGIKVPFNAGRHTFITMHVAAYGEPAKTEAIAGTSKEMRAAHYMGLASKRDGDRYFSILPAVGAAAKEAAAG